ncbi:TPA: DapH/DapD/GlmU-related protein [Bacillus paranthracis]
MRLKRKITNLKIVCRDVFINTIAASVLIPKRIRYIIYKFYGINTNTYSINPRCFFEGKNIQIGKGTRINYECFFDNSGDISIGKECSIGMRTMLITSAHKIGGEERRAGKAYGLSINIGDASWLGAGVTVLPGVTIGKGCIIASGSVVNKDCEANGLYAGVPAKRIKDLSAKKDIESVI